MRNQTLAGILAGAALLVATTAAGSSNAALTVTPTGTTMASR